MQSCSACAWVFATVVFSNRMMMRPPQADLGGAAAASPCSGATAALQALPVILQDRLHLPITYLFSGCCFSPPIFISVVLFRHQFACEYNPSPGHGRRRRAHAERELRVIAA